MPNLERWIFRSKKLATSPGTPHTPMKTRDRRFSNKKLDRHACPAHLVTTFFISQQLLQPPTMSIFLVNVNEEAAKRDPEYDMSTIWSPVQDGRGYNLIRDMMAGDNVIQYYCRDGRRAFVCGVVVAGPVEQYRPSVSDPRHNDHGFAIRVQIQYRIDVVRQHRGGAMWQTLVDNCNASNCMTYNPDAPFCLKTGNGFEYPSMTLRGYIWRVDEQLHEMFTLMFPGLV